MINTLKKFKYKNVYFRGINQNLVFQRQPLYNLFSLRLFSPNFTTLKNLDIDRLLQNKGSNKQPALSQDELFSANNKKNPEFKKESNILEFTNSLSWEDVVVNSTVPIVVDCYAL